jgi:hypothetical protein
MEKARHNMKSASATKRRLVAVGAATGVLLLVLALRSQVTHAQGNMPNMQCIEWNGDNRDCRGYFDSCVGPPQSQCSVDMCVIYDNGEWGPLADGWYCSTCPPGVECSCYGNAPVTGREFYDGSCRWGTMPPRFGECYCRNNYFRFRTITFYRCDS